MELRDKKYFNGNISKELLGCCALCPGIIDWKNYGIVPGYVKVAAIVCVLLLRCTLLWVMGTPPMLYFNGPTS